jgi:hypothetical protein
MSGKSSDSKAVGTGARGLRAAAMSAAFESVARACPERWILPPIQKIITDYDGIHCNSRSELSPLRARLRPCP